MGAEGPAPSVLDRVDELSRTVLALRRELRAGAEPWQVRGHLDQVLGDTVAIAHQLQLRLDRGLLGLDIPP